MTGEAPRIQVGRSRPVCPFCKGEVGGGHLWVCPACEAPHHGDCYTEHGDCATCSIGTARAAAPRVAADPKVRIVQDDDPRALEPRRRELLRLGFDAELRGPDELVATSARWSYDPLSIPVPHRVIVKRVEALTLDPIAEAALSIGPDSPITVLVFLADAITPEARAFIERGTATDLLLARPRLLVAAWCRGEGHYFRETPVLGMMRLPGLRFLARRVLFPQLAERAAREPARGALFVLLLLATALLLAIFAAAVSVGLS